MKYIQNLQKYKEELLKRDLIIIFESDRYDKGDIGFKEDFNMGYVQKFKVILGEDKEIYVDTKVKNLNKYWESCLMNDFYRFTSTLEIASEWADVSKYIKRIKEIND